MQSISQLSVMLHCLCYVNIISYLALHCPNNAPNHLCGISQNCSNLCSLPLGWERLYTLRLIPPPPSHPGGGGGGGGGTCVAGRKGGNPWGERRLYLFLNFLSQFSELPQDPHSWGWEGGGTINGHWSLQGVGGTEFSTQNNLINL